MLELETKEQALTLDLANERSKVLALEGDVVEAEVTTQVDIYKKVLVDKLTKDVAQYLLDLLSSFSHKGGPSNQA